MDQTTTTEWLDGHAMHLRVAERMQTMSRSSESRDRRDLGLLMTLAILAPLAMFAIHIIGSPQSVVGALMVGSVVAGLVAIRWIQHEYVIEPLSLNSQAGLGSTRRLGLIPQSHFGRRKARTQTLALPYHRNSSNS